jgi:hypothetical protein
VVNSQANQVLSGYYLQNGIGFLLSLSLFLCYWHRNSRLIPTKLVRQYLKGAMNSYQTSSIFFTFTIQTVTVIFRACKDYNTGNVRLTGGSLEVGMTVSLLTFIPLLYPLALGKQSYRHGFKRPHLNLLFISFCAFPHAYIALSRFISACSPLKSSGISLSEDEMGDLYHRCYIASSRISNKELMVSGGIALAESFIVLALAFYEVSTICSTPGKRFDGEGTTEGQYGLLRPVVYLVALPLFAVTQVLALTRLLSEQRGVAEVSGFKFAADIWSFGQFAALAVWIPVLAEPAFMWAESRWEGRLPGTAGLASWPGGD